jgi:hypothetical protein
MAFVRREAFSEEIAISGVASTQLELVAVGSPSRFKAAETWG